MLGRVLNIDIWTAAWLGIAYQQPGMSFRPGCDPTLKQVSLQRQLSILEHLVRLGQESCLILLGNITRRCSESLAPVAMEMFLAEVL